MNTLRKGLHGPVADCTSRRTKNSSGTTVQSNKSTSKRQPLICQLSIEVHPSVNIRASPQRHLTESIGRRVLVMVNAPTQAATNSGRKTAPDRDWATMVARQKKEKNKQRRVKNNAFSIVARAREDARRLDSSGASNSYMSSVSARGRDKRRGQRMGRELCTEERKAMVQLGNCKSVGQKILFQADDSLTCRRDSFDQSPLVMCFDV